MPRSIRATTAALCLALASPAAAQGPAQCEPKDPTTAEVNAREGVRLAKAGKFVEAVPLFRMAVRLDACAPEHLLLLARGLARSNQVADARRNYQQVIAAFPESMAARRARGELAALPANDPEPTEGVEGGTLEPPPPAGPNWLTVGLMTAGAGALVAVGGVFFAMDAQDADDELQTAAREPDRGHYEDLVDRRGNSTTLAYVFYGLGGAAIVTGVTLSLLPTLRGDASKPAAADAPRAAVVPLEGGGMITFGASF